MTAGAGYATLRVPAGTPLAGYGGLQRRLPFPDLLGRSTRDLTRELGAAYEREVVHRDDLVLL